MPAVVAPRASAPEELWPRWTPLIEAAIATLLAVVVALEPRPGLNAGARTAISVIPPVVWLWCATPKRPPFLVRAAIVFGAVAVLVWHPAKFDAAPFFLVLLIGESVVAARLWQSVVVAAASVALLGGLDVAGRFDGAVVWVLAFGFSWSGVALLQSRLRLIGEIGERAAFQERQRIARELHDVIAHSLAVTMLQLTGARLALERDPADAAQALLEAERLGRQSLAEIRRTIGLLAPGDGNPTTAMPTAADIPALVQEVTDAGLSVQLDCDGDLQNAPPTAGLSLYRIVQESLANVVKHTPGAAAHIQVRIDATHVRVDVRNSLATVTRAGPRRDDGGMGLVLMRERAELLGGTLRAGPEGQNWHVCVDLPTKLES
jgi:signal transduction histidine kinase